MFDYKLYTPKKGDLTPDAEKVYKTRPFRIFSNGLDFLITYGNWYEAGELNAICRRHEIAAVSDALVLLGEGKNVAGEYWLD